MSIITIAREHGAWTRAASARLAERLNAVLLTKDELEKRLTDAGMKAKLFQRYDERKPGFFSSFSPDQDVYLLYLKTAMLQAAKEGNVVVLGRGAHLMLEDIPSCLRVRLVAPEDIRIKNIQQEYGFDEETANRVVHKCDADRAGFCHFHFNAEWDDASLYDLVVNTQRLTEDDLVELLASQVQRCATPENEALSKKLIDVRLLEQRVSTVLLVEQKLSFAFLDVQADDNGAVTLLGATTTPAAARQAADAAATVPGVASVTNKIRVSIEIAQSPTPRV